MPRPRVSLPLLALFFASGASGLVYEVVWMRLLSLTLSVTVYAVTTVLCAFMAGLALGAALAGRVGPRLRRPLLAYGVIELAIGATALATPAVLWNLAPLYVRLYGGMGGSGVAFAVARFLLAFAVLLVPSTLMGMTLPLLSRAAIAHEGAVGRGAGALYAINTLGAVAGCLGAGFLLIPRWGLDATNHVAAALSAAVGLGAMVLARRDVAAPAAAAAPARARASSAVRRAYVAIAVSGFTALGYQVLWTRALVHYTHNSTYAYSAMLATFLFGLGLGSALAARRADRLRAPTLALGLVEIAIGATVVAALVLYGNLDRLIPAVAGRFGGLTSWSRVVALIFLEAGSVLLLTTLLFGATFPLVARIAVDRLEAVAPRIAAAYTANTAGAILGALLVGFVILPALGMRGAFLALVAANLLVGVWLALAETPRPGRAAAAAALAVLAAAFWLVPARLFEESFVRRFGPLLFYREEVTDTVMVTEDPRGARMIRFGDGRGTAGTATMPEDRMYAHVPLLLHPAPRRVLNICFGVGNSLASVLTHPIERVDSVELSPGVLDAAPYFQTTNHDVLADPRIVMNITDGRNFLLASRDRYDVIRLDPPELHTAGVVNLYTREFYELARAHLRPGGIFSIWVNIVMTPEPDLQLLVRTVASVFPHVSVWHGPYRYSWVINGSMTPHDPDLARLMQALAEPRVRDDLGAIGVHDAFGVLSHFVFAEDEVAAFAGDGPLVTDDHTRLDFTVPRSLDSSFGFANANTDSWLVELMDPVYRKQLPTRIFFTKLAQMWALKRPVLPHLVNVAATGLSEDEVRERLTAAGAIMASGPDAGARASLGR